jgi:hypothetical protein
MPHLRVESVKGHVRLITADDRTLTPDIVTIRLQDGRVTMIKCESKDKPPEYFNVNKFFGNGGTK